MGQTVSSEILHALTTCLSAAFTRGLSGVEPQWNRIASEVPSSSASNTYGWMNDLPDIKEWVGERQLATLDGYGYTITNKLWESSIRVKREHIEDDQIGQYSITAERYGRMTAVFPDKLCYALLCAGFKTLCFDGQNFFDEDHPLGDGTYSNVVGTPASDNGEPWFLIDESQVLKPIIWQTRRAFNFEALDDLNSEHTFRNHEFLYGVDGRCNAGFGFWQTAVGSRAALTVENYKKANELLRGMKGTNGEPLGIRPTTLVVGPKNRADAKLIIDAMLVNGGDSNIWYKDVEIVDSPYITTPA
ncbi:Mu-like prophage major head subunit gpT family protein [Escherichia coli]|uniref:Mu-like prophage major head subunit gpT family protein n=1 Tax=Escherichia coli TaxID=562 RepID=UPI000A919715|nr:Mu-like prophage major head subunit gpT family protein [Escherichia coli]